MVQLFTSVDCVGRICLDDLLLDNDSKVNFVLPRSSDQVRSVMCISVGQFHIPCGLLHTLQSNFLMSLLPFVSPKNVRWFLYHATGYAVESFPENPYTVSEAIVWNSASCMTHVRNAVTDSCKWFSKSQRWYRANIPSGSFCCNFV